MAESYDLIVVGAGPAGASAAWAAAKKGVKVLLVDRRQRIGIPVQCAELVTPWVSNHVPFGNQVLIQSVDTMVLHLPDGQTLERKNPGFMLDRSLFDKELVISAVLAGAELSTGTKALQVIPEGLLLQRGRKEDRIQAKVIIGADGVHSTIASSTHQPPLKTVRALQYEVVLQERRSSTHIYFHPDYEGGYAWFFPKGNTANAGLGVVSSRAYRLSEYLHRFLRQLKDAGTLSKIEIVSKTGGSIPCEPRNQTVVGNILLVGDAAGHAHPITGAGIFNAVVGGAIAGRIAAEAILQNDLDYLNHYETEWSEAFGRSLRYGGLKRKVLETHWNKDGTDFKELIRKTWVGFKEYYEERRKERNGHQTES